MTPKKPWEVDPKLAKARILLVMEVIVKARRDLQPLYVKGDSPWSHGCRAYAWILDGFEQLEHDLKERGETWLRTKRNNNFFVLWIEDVVVRFYRGDPDLPNERALYFGQQLQGSLPGILSAIDPNAAQDERTNEWAWMLSYESQPMPWNAKDVAVNDGLVIAASLCQARRGRKKDDPAETRNMWTVPVGIGEQSLTAITENVAKAHESERPKVTIKATPKRRKTKSSDDNGDT
jgi:hypothetical protein